jgi:hypothetical protein
MNLIIRNLYKLALMENHSSIKTKFISYKDGGPENMFVD